MADVTPEFEARELALMRAWMEADRAALKRHVAGECVMLFGTAPRSCSTGRAFSRRLREALR
ncbi:hypothetical protein [Erythrobacter sp.]|uniref:hypothetical protein n=1 Tax=Erythrobacter sp. TaxID=1042 RepID=UPI0025C301D0|nr:hypothetical protein [Erythrobacter sp.]